MELDEYQRQAYKFRADSSTREERVFGLLEEAGEVAGVFKRLFRGDFGRDESASAEAAARLYKELGDVLWYLSQIAEDNDWKLSDVAKGNLDKLESRKIRNMLLGSGDNR